jgi:hypothetical protein
MTLMERTWQNGWLVPLTLELPQAIGSCTQTWLSSQGILAREEPVAKLE